MFDNQIRITEIQKSQRFALRFLFFSFSLFKADGETEIHEDLWKSWISNLGVGIEMDSIPRTDPIIVST